MSANKPKTKAVKEWNFMDQELDDRKKKILKAIIKTYMETGEPVGSRTISKFADLNVSSATIRNEMSDLTDMGYIVQPHTSAGRIPSDKGYRLYVDELTREKEAEIAEIRDLIRVMHQLCVGFQLFTRDAAAVSTQGVWFHQQAHLKHAVHIFFGDAGDHQPLFRQDGDEAFLLQPPQSVPHRGTADIAHLCTELLFVQKLVWTIFAVQDPGLEILICLQFQAWFRLRIQFFHTLTTPIPSSVPTEKVPSSSQCTLSSSKRSCILAAIQVIFQFYYFIVGQLLQDFFINFGAFSVLANFYVSFLPNLTKFFCACSQFSLFYSGLCIQHKNMLQ